METKTTFVSASRRGLNRRGSDRAAALTSSPAQDCSQAISPALLVTLVERYTDGSCFTSGGGPLRAIHSASSKGSKPSEFRSRLWKLSLTAHSLSRIDSTNAAIASICAAADSTPDSVTASG